MMKLGFVSAILPELTLNELLAFAAAEGFHCVEVMCWPPGKAERRFAGVTHVDVLNFTQAQADDLNALCSQHGVSFSGLGYYPNPLDPNPAVARAAVEHLKRVIRAASLLGVRQVNTFVGRDWTRTVDENWPRFLKTWKPLVAFAEDHNVRIGIENCPRSASVRSTRSWADRGRWCRHSPAPSGQCITHNSCAGAGVIAGESAG